MWDLHFPLVLFTIQISSVHECWSFKIIDLYFMFQEDCRLSEFTMTSCRLTTENAEYLCKYVVFIKLQSFGGYIGIFQSVRLSKYLVSTTPPYQMNLYWWNFTQLQYTTWGCAWRRIITVQTFSREIISSDRGIGFDLQFYLYLNQTEICTYKYKKYHQTVASLVNTMKIQPLKIMVAGCWRSLTHSPTHSCQSKLMPHKSRSIYLFG